MSGLKQKLLRLQSECYKTVKTNTRTGSMVVSAGQMARKQAFDEILVLLDDVTIKIQDRAKSTFQLCGEKCRPKQYDSNCRGLCKFCNQVFLVRVDEVLAILGVDGKEKAKP